MKKIVFLMLLCPLLVSSCKIEKTVDREEFKSEIAAAEKAFAELAAEEGVNSAFIHYAAEDAVILRGESVVEGRESIIEFLDSRPDDNVELKWSPDFIDVSASGDLGYTYGKYSISVTDSMGNKQEGKGIFHTVWKRQEDGSWKFVWD